MLGRILLFLVLGSASDGAAAQEAFERVYGGPGFERGVFVEPLRDGGFAVVGVANDRADRAEVGEDIYLLRTDASGETLWSRRLGGDDADNGWVIRETGDGLVLAGYTKSSGFGGFDFFLASLDASGEIRWTREFGGAGDERCWAMIPTADGGFALAGETGPEDEEDFYLVRTDGEGNELWSRQYGGAKGDRCFSMQQTDDGGFLLAGQTYSEGAGDRDAFVVKTSAAGDYEWSKSFGGPAKDVGHCITANRDGSFLLSGYSASGKNPIENPFLACLDDSGEVLWKRTLAMDGMKRSLTAEEAVGGGFYMTGLSVNAASGHGAVLLLKTDADADLEWQRDILPTNRGQSFGYTVRALPDGGCVLTGHTTVGSNGAADLLLVRVSN